MKTAVQLLLLTAVGLTHSATLDSRASKLKIKEHYREGQGFSKLYSAGPSGNAITRAGWKVTCDSFEPGFECINAIDGKNDTFWHTAYTKSPLPHQIVVDLGVIKNVNGMSALPRIDGNDHGFITGHEVAVSKDKEKWETVATGTWYGGDATPKYSNFETRSIRYLRLRATSEVWGNPWTSIAELNIYEAKSGPTPFNCSGIWGPTIDFPTVPVAAVVNPWTGNVLIWSSYTYDNYLGSTQDRVFTATWDPDTNAVTPKLVDNTDHDMFCPGISIDGTGKMVVTGGNSAKKTSFYDFAKQSWAVGPDMNTPRGYQSSVTLSDGSVFTIGGSWSGGWFEKNGELYDPSSNNWTSLKGAAVKPMLTNDAQGIYRADNHAWLFGWKNASVFQAGPSTAMNWYSVSGNGGVTPAGKRRSSRGVDGDSMNGNAIMYDAVEGKILTVGGSPSYQDSDATNHAHIITLGDVDEQPQVRGAGRDMWFPRAFHNSVVLPDGTTFIAGGQSHAVPFSDETPQLTPELYDPFNDTFYLQQPNSIVRVYHSVSLLLPDGRVFNGGGGLCADCYTNHFDAQVFTPQYLLTDDGKPATRPVIKSISKTGRTITIVTDSPVDSASLIRYGTATHSVDTDQRRVPLKLTSAGTNQYTVVVPSDPGVVIPGFYMLFVLNSDGVPSVSKTVKYLI